MRTARTKPRGDTAGEGSTAHSGHLGEMEIAMKFADFAINTDSEVNLLASCDPRRTGGPGAACDDSCRCVKLAGLTARSQAHADRKGLPSDRRYVLVWIC